HGYESGAGELGGALRPGDTIPIYYDSHHPEFAWWNTAGPSGASPSPCASGACSGGTTSGQIHLSAFEGSYSPGLGGDNFSAMGLAPE
ncbi:hypothetical protein, partial [Verrucomicrobium spinosum]|uniref:hypothetical protein n=1 Tax=Verrucomicrobium spinosum TaxID=2736 RepID=UPI001C483ADB